VERELDVGRHGVLRVLEPLLVAEARFSTGELESAERLLTIASGAIVDAPCLELDWRIELLRARVALRRGDRSSARRYVQRSLHVRGLLIELVPASARKALLAHLALRGPRRDGGARRTVTVPREDHGAAREPRGVPGHGGSLDGDGSCVRADRSPS
jgi:hypothetical protein